LARKDRPKDKAKAEKSFLASRRRVCIRLATYAQPFLEGFVMAFFKELTDITDPAKYVNELKAAFRSPNGKKFAYFNNHPKCPKRPHLVLVDYEGGIAKLLGGTPKAEGKVIITDKEEISFETTKGAMKVRPLKKYIETFYKTRPILVPTNEPEDEENVGAPNAQAPNTANIKPNETNTSPAPKPPLGPPPGPQSEAPEQQTAPKLDTRMDKKVAFEENAFKRRQLLARVQELQSASFPSELATLKKSSLEKARDLAEKDNFGEAEKLLNGLAARLRTLPTRPPPPTLSAYMNATTQWKSAKAAAEDGVFKLKKAILEACDPELKDVVKAKIDGVNTILAPLDDVIVKKIDEARSDSDEERRTGREQAIGKLANERLQALRQHPLAGVADSNPFGNFNIRAPMEEFFTKIASTFGI
jgi:hypothetical protein